jgi:hypothetical protein
MLLTMLVAQTRGADDAGVLAAVVMAEPDFARTRGLETVEGTAKSLRRTTLTASALASDRPALRWNLQRSLFKGCKPRGLP